MNEINPENQEWCRCGAMLGANRIVIVGTEKAPREEFCSEDCAKPSKVNRIVHEMENAVYYGMNLRFALLRENPVILNTLLDVLARAEESRPAKEKNKHI